MHFTYEAYEWMIERLQKQGYSFAFYHNWKEYEKCVIFRHDIDYDLSKSMKLAEIEARQGVKSTYFVLLTSDLYNVFSKNNIKIIKHIASLGHEIGIHFDETCYSRNDDLAWAIQKEARILGEAIEQDVKTVSMHRPSKGLLDENIQIDGIINSYSDVFFKEFKYISDSRRRWREPVEEIINTGAYNRLHILTHAFWYNEIEIDLYESVFGFIRSAQQERYSSMAENITDIESIEKNR